MDFVKKLGKYTMIVGYNILNEPHPERISDSRNSDTENGHFENIDQDENQRLLYEFYHKVVDGIRKIDKNTPIILDSSAWANPQTFKKLRPIPDEFVLYSFHMYEPYEFTSHENKGEYSYPGDVMGKYWDQKTLKDYMETVAGFQREYNIPSTRILVGEFGCHRQHKDLVRYFKDLLEIFVSHGWHFAFYAFREDTWDGMDYELGDGRLHESYWQEVEKGKIPRPDRSGNHPQFSVLLDAYKSGQW
jgi:hypothetical protein